MSIFTPEILELGKTIAANCANWGVDDNTAYAEFNGERETAPIIQTRNEWMPVAIRRANEQAHHALERRLGVKIEHYRYDRSHPSYG